MNRFMLLLVAAMAAAVFTVPAAVAQTPANITITSGNGQLICPTCTNAGAGLQTFEPFYVKVTDANGNPVSGATVTWTVTNGPGYFSSTLTPAATSTTDANGNSSIQFLLPTETAGPYIANSVSASITTGASVTFYATLGVNGSATTALTATTTFPSCTTCVNPGDTLTGPAGSTSAYQVQVGVYDPTTELPVPNISLRLISNQASPTASCATGAGADPGSVLTGSNGVATCTVVFGPTTGRGSFYFLLGGVNQDVITQNPIGYLQLGNYNINVTAGTAGMISLTSGNSQSGNPGQALSAPLVATVASSAGTPLSGQQVVWTVNPSGAATLSGTTTTSSSSGQVQTNVTLSSSAAGSVQVRVALASNSNIFATFTINANTQISGLQIVSGNNQSAVLNTAFSLPLVVQLSASNGSTTANIPISFSVTGPATLSSSSATTNSAGQAQVNVTAGSTAGAVTVVASAGGYNATFALTVVPQGPSITVGSFFNGADFQAGSLSPCSIATIIAPGIAPAIQGAVAYDGVGGLPYSLAGDSLTVGGAQAPVYNVANLNGQQQLTFQVPCSVTPGSGVPVMLSVSGSSASVSIPILPASPGLFETQLSSTVTVPVLERPDGSFVSTTNPARRGETIIAYVTGLGATTPSIATNSLPVPGSKVTPQGTVIVGINGNGANLISATLSPDIVGVYQVAFQVPSTVTSGTNASFSIGLLPMGSGTVYYSTLGTFPVQ